MKKILSLAPAFLFLTAFAQAHVRVEIRKQSQHRAPGFDSSCELSEQDPVKCYEDKTCRVVGTMSGQTITIEEIIFDEETGQTITVVRAVFLSDIKRTMTIGSDDNQIKVTVTPLP